LVRKIRDHADRIARCEERGLEDADVVVVAYGITSRVAQRAIQMARAEGLHVGLLRPVVVWPFPERRVRELAQRVHAFVVVEMNYGQMVYEVERCAGDKARTVLVAHGGGTVHEPEEILKAIREAAE
jgi:2-oxoglutarate ferredoxin oxidoreductase subunit alpha